MASKPPHAAGKGKAGQAAGHAADAPAQRRGPVSRPPRVLFVCVGNAGRSQMAEAFARHAGLDAESAGTEPAPRLSSAALALMRERGIDISGQRPKALDWDRLPEFDRVVTMGCGVAESCPTLRTDEDWGLEDPVGRSIEEVRPIRDEIERRVARLATQLTTDARKRTA